MRKFWLVNGTHTALGVLCENARLQILCDGLANEEIASTLRRLQEEWVRILLSQVKPQEGGEGIFAFSDLLVHAERMFERFRDLPQFSVRDVLKELSDLENSDKPFSALQRLMQKLDDRLARAVRLAMVDEVPVPTSGLVLSYGIDTVRRYADNVLG